MAMVTRGIERSDTTVRTAAKADGGPGPASASAAFSEILQSETKTAENGTKTSMDNRSAKADRKDSGTDRDASGIGKNSAKAAAADTKEDEKEFRTKAETELSILSSMMNAQVVPEKPAELTGTGKPEAELAIASAIPEEGPGDGSLSEIAETVLEEGTLSKLSEETEKPMKTTGNAVASGKKEPTGPASDPELLAKAQNAGEKEIVSLRPAEGPAREGGTPNGPALEATGAGGMKKPEPGGLSAKEKEAIRNGYSPEDAAAANASAGLKTQTTAQPQEAPKTASVRQVPTYEFETTEDSLVDDVSGFMEKHMPPNDGRMVLELNPRNLGKITIEVEYKGQEAHITMTASSTKTADLLSRGAESMGSILTRRTGNDTQVYVPHTGTSDSGRDAAEKREGSGEGRQQQEARRQEQAQKNDAREADSFLSRMRLGLM
ncbi:hook-length control protein FliK [[Clostridium] aminophilum]|uniref:Hook-length control protein FliK n=1 Tax=[Clostridium] aminophilum TaxID=1526 RepID=A0A1I0BRT2_9FIRM|nr:flagellar hook-length control protein FliK [[Clostridium] aminophilum]SET09675.1 hook-length control protein FliK [[Clostridium] aminophilum]